MKIDFLEIINFRNMRSAALDFANRNFVALIGDNGSGKTTILESITKAFVPVLRAVNGEAVKQCDLSNTDIKEGTSSVAVTLGMILKVQNTHGPIKGEKLPFFLMMKQLR